MRNVKKTLRAFIGILLSSPVILAQDSEVILDHFGPEEDVSALVIGAQCMFSDTIGVVLRSNWQQRHWIKIAGEQVEFNGATEMSDAGWYQEFEGGEFTVALRLQRVLPERAGGDSVRLEGEIDVAHSGETRQYQVTGICGA